MPGTAIYAGGADAKVRQLEERYPTIVAQNIPSNAGTNSRLRSNNWTWRRSFAYPKQSRVRSSRTSSSILSCARPWNTLGPSGGLLIMLQGGEPRIEAEAITRLDRIEVVVHQKPVTPSDLPQSALHRVIRKQESVLLDDALADNIYSKDEYVGRKRSRSILCLPIVKQKKLIGALYLENNLAPRVFTPDRVTVLQLLASQAAISLENAALYTDLQLQVALLQHFPVSAWTLQT